MNEGHCDGCDRIDDLRRELDMKHGQNRADIHKLRNDAQIVLLELTELKGQILPIVGVAGQPGILAQLRAELGELSKLITELRIAQGADTGRRSENEWLRSAIVTAIVGLLLIVAQHMWR